MTSTADRYREAGMPPPRGEVPIADARRFTRRSRKRTTEVTHDPSIDGPVLPEVDPTAYGPDSVPLGMTDTNSTEETS